MKESMKLLNPIKMNNWKIKKFFIFIFSIQISVIGIIALSNFNLYVPIIYQVILLIYLLFIPGILIIRILKLHNIDTIETILYSIGLSIATLMFLGFFIDIIYPYLGINNPISLKVFIITSVALVLFLSILCYFRDRNFFIDEYIDIKPLISPSGLLLCIIPFFSIIGTYLLNYYDFNFLNIVLILLIGLILILVVFNKISEKLYPLAIFVTSLSLLFFTSLISNYVWGNDIQIEYRFANMVINSSFWDITIYNVINSVLSTDILAPILSESLKMNLDGIFKIIYPLIYSLLPLGLFKIFQKQTNSKIAFLSVFFFISMFSFYTDMVALPRQEIAELFLVLFLMVLISYDIEKLKKSILIIIFVLSLIVSHYSLSYFLVFITFSALLIDYLNKHFKIISTRNHIYSSNQKTVSLTLAILFITFTFAWYMYTGGSSAFNSIVFIGNKILDNFLNDFSDPTSTQGLNILISEYLPMHSITKYLNLMAIIAISTGIYSMLKKNRRMNFRTEYLLISLVAFIICIMSLIIPNFSSQLQTSRLYHITLIVLAPFVIIGFIFYLNILNKFLHFKKSLSHYYKLISLFLVIFLIFNSGLIYELTNEKKNSASLMSFDKNFDFSTFNQQEINGAQWTNQYIDHSMKVYADVYRTPILYRIGGNAIGSFYIKQGVNKNSFIYFGSLNTNQNKILILPNNDYINTEQIIKNDDKIYSNGGSTLYFHILPTIINPS